MEETKIWAVEGNDTSATQLDTVNQMETEVRLEDILAANSDMLEDGLQLVGRQASTAGGTLDLLGVDTDGRLVVYELKRGRLSRYAVAQVIDYASSLNAMDEETLYQHISDQSGNLDIQEIENFGEWYSDNWSDEGSEALMPPRMVLVGLGVDDTTERMVQYMKSSGMDISLVTFQGFRESDGKTLLTRNVKVGASDSPSRIRSSGKTSAPERRRLFDEHATELHVKELLDASRSMFLEQFRSQFRDARGNRMHFNRDKTSFLFIELEEADEKNGIQLGFHPVAVDLELEKFEQLDSKDIPIRKDPSRNKHTEKVDYEVKFSIYSLDEWDTHKDKLAELTKAVYEAYQKTQSV